ncbi:cation:proton antiporter regulatory subunit [Halomicroarcula sp. GCM10025817]|uniref:cation:proton antiporter regulatory subunit n=1 Tax=Halomicroarcula sp. GCM10025817 TaxID=3252672 RepID=UPI003614D8BB
MAPLPISEILVGVYLGLIAALFPSFIAFSIGFGFKYFTNVTVPGLGVVALGGTLAGVTGGLMGLIDPQLASGWAGITAILVILMGCLWAHSQGDKLGAATPRRLTLKSLRESQLSAELAERVDSYGQIRIRPTGDIHDIEGYPPLPENLREQLRTSSWKFPADLSLTELETRLEERLTTDHELAEVAVVVDKRGRAEISAAPSAAGLSRRIPSGKRAVSIQTLLPTGVARGDSVTVKLPDGGVTGPVVSARTNGVEASKDPEPAPTEAEDDESDENLKKPTLTTSTTTGGEGQVSVALPAGEARRVVGADFAPMIVHSRGKQREYEAIGVLKQHGNRFKKVTIGDESTLSGTTIGTAQVRDTYGVGILAIRRATERLIAPRGATELLAGDTLIIVGRSSQLQTFEEVAT